jgi:hypothetical protein
MSVCSTVVLLRSCGLRVTCAMLLSVSVWYSCLCLPYISFHSGLCLVMFCNIHKHTLHTHTQLGSLTTSLDNSYVASSSPRLSENPPGLSRLPLETVHCVSLEYDHHCDNCVADSRKLCLDHYWINMTVGLD